MQRVDHRRRAISTFPKQAQSYDKPYQAVQELHCAGDVQHELGAGQTAAETLLVRMPYSSVEGLPWPCSRRQRAHVLQRHRVPSESHRSCWAPDRC